MQTDIKGQEDWAKRKTSEFLRQLYVAVTEVGLRVVESRRLTCICVKATEVLGGLVAS